MELSNREEAAGNALYVVDFEITPLQYCEQHMPHLSKDEVKAFVENMPNPSKIPGIRQSGILVPVPNKRYLQYPIQKKKNLITLSVLLRFFKGLPDNTKIYAPYGKERKYLSLSNAQDGYFGFCEYTGKEWEEIVTVGKMFEWYLMCISYGGKPENDIISLEHDDPSCDSHSLLAAYSLENGEVCLTFSHPE